MAEQEHPYARVLARDRELERRIAMGDESARAERDRLARQQLIEDALHADMQAAAACGAYDDCESLRLQGAAVTPHVLMLGIQSGSLAFLEWAMQYVPSPTIAHTARAAELGFMDMCQALHVTYGCPVDEATRAKLAAYRPANVQAKYV